MEQKTFQVPGIGCDGCVRTIQNEVGQLPGVKHVEADEQTKLVTVQWDAPASWPQIANLLREIDYAPAEA
jgi:copper chaperone